jgi:hypothetical protein
VALLSGRNFQTKQFEETIAEESFSGLKQGVINFISENHFKRFVMIIRSAGFIDASLVGGQNALNFAYILYLRGRKDGIPAADLESLVRRWFVMTVLTQRYSGNPETAFDFDIRQVGQRGMANHVNAVVEAELSTGFWNTLLPQEMETSSAASPYFRTFQAAQVKLCDPGFLSKDIKVTDLILNRCDVHHLFPKGYLKEAKIPRGRYNQIANFALAQTEINIAIGARAPSDYMRAVLAQCENGKKRYGGITDIEQLRENLRVHCIPEGIENMQIENYDGFLSARRQLMAQRIKEYFSML